MCMFCTLANSIASAMPSETFWGKSVSELKFISPLVLTNPLMKIIGNTFFTRELGTKRAFLSIN